MIFFTSGKTSLPYSRCWIQLKAVQVFCCSAFNFFRRGYKIVNKIINILFNKS